MKNTTMASVLCMLLSSAAAQDGGQEKPTAEQFWTNVKDQAKGMTFEEYSEGYKSVSQDVDEGRIWFTFSMGDKDADGALSKDEFTTLYELMMSKAATDIDLMWNRVGDPERGMTMEDFIAISNVTNAQLIQEIESLKEAKWSEFYQKLGGDVFAMADENSDGTLQYEEFAKLFNEVDAEWDTKTNGEDDWEKIFWAMDYNNDGSLSQSEHYFSMFKYKYDFQTMIDSDEKAFGGQYKLDNNGGLSKDEFLRYTESFVEKKDEERGMEGMMEEFMDGDHIIASMGGTKIMIKMGAAMLQASVVAGVSAMTLF